MLSVKSKIKNSAVAKVTREVGAGRVRRILPEPDEQFEHFDGRIHLSICRAFWYNFLDCHHAGEFWNDVTLEISSRESIQGTRCKSLSLDDDACLDAKAKNDLTKKIKKESCIYF